MLGWVTGKHTPAVQDWSCSQCTLINSGTRTNCEVCLTPKTSTDIQKSQTVDLTLPKPSGSKPPVKRKCKLEAELEKENKKRKVSSGNPSQSDIKKDDRRSKGGIAIHVSTDNVGKHVVPLCSGHNKRCTTRQVHKQGENKGRLFYACSMQREKNCQFFKVQELRFALAL